MCKSSISLDPYVKPSPIEKMRLTCNFLAQVFEYIKLQLSEAARSPSTPGWVKFHPLENRRSRRNVDLFWNDPSG
jgi:hypothetical protein